jgi:hypothetical protein
MEELMQTFLYRSSICVMGLIEQIFSEEEPLQLQATISFKILNNVPHCAQAPTTTRLLHFPW